MLSAAESVIASSSLSAEPRSPQTSPPQSFPPFGSQDNTQAVDMASSAPLLLLLASAAASRTLIFVTETPPDKQQKRKAQRPRQPDDNDDSRLSGATVSATSADPEEVPDVIFHRKRGNYSVLAMTLPSNKSLVALLASRCNALGCSIECSSSFFTSSTGKKCRFCASKPCRRRTPCTPATCPGVQHFGTGSNGDGGRQGIPFFLLRHCCLNVYMHMLLSFSITMQYEPAMLLPRLPILHLLK